MKKYLVCIIVLAIFLLNINFCYATTYRGQINTIDVNLRSGPGTNYENIKNLNQNNYYNLVSMKLYESEEGCQSGWYRIYYDSNNTGYVCSTYITITTISNITKDKYERPWTTPYAAIVGGAKFITEKYINAGQFNSYLKKFNVNPNADNKVYNHQYMDNLQAPYSESFSSYQSYRDNGLLLLPLEFTIPVFENMPDYTKLPGKDVNTACQSEVKDVNFEALLDKELFPESYKCKLRLIHEKFPNWVFKALHTTLDFHKSVIAEQNVSSIQGGDKYYDLSSGGKEEIEDGWYRANYDTVAYYLDPRNFLVEERILMFEYLGYSANYTNVVVSNILKGTFMDNYSLLDNKLYSDMFVDAGFQANISAVYLAALARQESGTRGSRATTGEQFNYKGISYVSLYNFYNIGASSSAESPILAGLVWASGGSTDVIVNEDMCPNPPEMDMSEIEVDIVNKLEVTKSGEYLIGFSVGEKLSDIKNKLIDYVVRIDNAQDEDVLKTGQKIIINKDSEEKEYIVVVAGDVDGDGSLGATDYVKIKNYIMEKSGSELNMAQSLAADVDGNNEIGATDYVKIKNSIMEG